ncbi:MAG: hypothetical protein OEL83_01075 [Desulforhopalus sp.]|nr:hypothetical protein [Desulforhopalus sp.]
MSKKKIILGVLAVGFLWWLFFGGSEKWKEEVQLSDGRIIVIHRETIREGGGDEISINSSGSKPKEHRIQFTNPDGSGKKIEWRSTKMTPSNRPEISLILDIENGHPVLYGSVFVRDGCENYLKYVFKNDRWDEENLPEKFPERKTNLLIRDGTSMPRFVDLEDKKKMNSQVGYAKSLRKVGPNREICGSD